MELRRRLPATPSSTALLVAAFLVLVLAIRACAPDVPAYELERAPQSEPTLAASVARDEAAEFLDRYVDGDGRVVRHDQGGDTVSEGQAYGMLLAVAIGDRARFDLIWNWTSANLRRPDGLLAWHWADGQIVDPNPAADADVDAAHALALAAKRFDDGAYADEARALAAAVVEHEVVSGRLGPVLVAGPWAVADRWVNPSYGAPVAFEALAAVTGSSVWQELDDGARRVVGGNTSPSDLPPDWARLTDHAVAVQPPPGGGSISHAYDAARTSIRLAVDCDRAGRELAASMDDEYDGATVDDGSPAAVLDLSGEPQTDYGHPVMAVAAAASSIATGDRDDAARLLAVAEDQDRATPTYYGAAWISLGRLWLTTDLLGGCVRG